MNEKQLLKQAKRLQILTNNQLKALLKFNKSVLGIVGGALHQVMSSGNLGLALQVKDHLFEMSNIVFPKMSIKMLQENFIDIDLCMTEKERSATILAIIDSSDLIHSQINYSASLADSIVRAQSDRISGIKMAEKRMRLANLLVLIDNEAEIAAAERKKRKESANGK